MVEQKIKFPVFDYQGFPILFALFMLGGMVFMSDLHDIESIILGILLFSLGALPMCAFLFHRRYIIRIDSSDHIIFGQEFTEKFDIKKRKIPICDLSYSTYEVTRSYDDAPGTYNEHFMEIKENGKKIIEMEDYDLREYDSAPNFIQRLAPTWKESLKSTLPELFEIGHIISINQKLMSLDAGFNPIKTDEKPVIEIFQAEIIDGHLHGYTTDLNDEERLEAYVEYCLGLRKPMSESRVREYARDNPDGAAKTYNKLKSSSIYDMIFDENKATRLETKQIVYRVEYKNWKVIPSNYPSNTKGDWWDEK
ncbi:hypothetical protein N9M84_00970 [Candidatus Poseidoniales archaeon]|jgi:hypothetical protein|nr:hypothetical protein [Candidatus Poseidoniales archaeon]